MHILLTNDDGYQAKGIQTLFHFLKSLDYKVTMVAPRSERSAQSHAMSFYQSVQVEHIAEDIYSVNGTPADCAAIGLSCILKNNLPDIVISGINHGFNVGIDVNYSGTVGAATEAALMGFKAIAVSMDNDTSSSQLLEESFQKTAALIGKVLKNSTNLEWPKLQVMNINVPFHYKSLAVASCGSESLYIPHIEELPSLTQKEVKLYLIGGISRFAPKDMSQDVSLVESGFATFSFVSAKQSSTNNTSNLEKMIGSILNER